MSGPISIVVPHYDDLNRLDTLLAMLEAQTLPRDRFEIIVSDNLSPCGKAAVAARIAGRARLVTCSERGAGPTRNAGVAAATHPLLAFIDSDCQPEPGWLAAGLAALDRTDLVGGRMRVAVREPGRRSGPEAFEQVFAFDNRRYVEEHGFSVTANLFTRRAVFDAVGGFRTEVSEDLDWCRRAVAAGYRIAYAEGAVVAHPARADWAELLRKWRRLQQESYALALERPGGRLRWLVRASALPASIPVHGLRIWRTGDLANTAERSRALATLVRLRLWRLGHALRLAWGRA